MPLRGLDFSRSNQTIARFNQFLQYDLLDEKRSLRDVEQLRYSDVLQRGRAEQQGQIQKDVDDYRNKLDVRKVYVEGYVKFSGLPGADKVIALASLMGAPDLPQEMVPTVAAAAEQLKTYVEGYANAQLAAIHGKTTAKNFADATIAAGTRGSEEIMKETGTNIRSQYQVAVDAERNRIEAIKAEATKGGKSTTDRKAYYDIIHDKVTGVIGYLKGVKADVASGIDLSKLKTPSEWLNLKKLVGGELTTENLGKQLTRLSQLDTQAIRNELKPEEEAEIDDAYNIFQVQSQFEGVAADQIPAGTPTAVNPQTGERVALIGGIWKKVKAS